MDDTLTLGLEGQVTLEDFEVAMRHFRGVVAALSADVGAKNIQWDISDLYGGSAAATVRGLGPSDAVERVVRAYEQVGQALERHKKIPFSSRVQREASGLVALVNGRIDGIRIETANQEHLVTREARRVEETDADFPRTALGVVQGVVETLARRGGLRFTLYDLMHNRAVSCYLTPGNESTMRNAWGHTANVYGTVRRDPATGRPLSVRQITKVEVIDAGQPSDWRLAEGAAPRLPGDDSSPEAAIRAIRDA